MPAKYNGDEWIGKKFGKLTVVEIVKADDTYKFRGWLWKAKCDCGNDTTVMPCNVIAGKTLSCGCNARTHGKSHTRLYSIWYGMIRRCNVNDKTSKWHGQRGITVCDEWKKFECFEEWAVHNGYRDDLSIERINNDGNYEPNNCTWIPIGMQSRNRRNTIMIEHKGRKMSLGEACEMEGLPYMLVFNRIYHCKWSVKNALSIGAIRNK